MRPSYRPKRRAIHRAGPRFPPSLNVRSRSHARVPGPPPARLDACRHAMPHALMVEMMAQLRRVCVYCGSNPGHDRAFVAAATRFGEILADNGVGLVYGGGSGGLMGALATALLPRRRGIIRGLPEFL